MLSVNIIIIISSLCILFIIIGPINIFNLNNNKLCKSGDLYCENTYGKQSYCSFHNENPTCYDKDHNNTHDYCSCQNDDKNKNSYNYYIILSIIFVILIVCVYLILSKSKSKPIEQKLEFMFT